ncbi:C-type lysozyme inhibitor [Enterobacteriaceae bacterium H11S18]|uniref:C-type lysozyme inhibitor n=1 Tax=Enterobacteriaceae TaxID=543 RepID=UPI001928009E|nr:MULTISPECIES: C-type lysozyme inhibitor [Enterobacteriaceae]MCT4705700.1 C-type lysozyme inhibitor [Dryocola clanedunensis]MCT4711690.1 C-type lysozyme inhibitor [Dryocola clanedunensis]
MKKLLVATLPMLLAGCSYYNSFVERMQTDTLQYQCDEKPLTVKLNKEKQMVNFVYDDDYLSLTQGLSASGARYTDGVYVFWSKGDSATVYRKDSVVLNNCQLQKSKS